MIRRFAEVFILTRSAQLVVTIDCRLQLSRVDFHQLRQLFDRIRFQCLIQRHRVLNGRRRIIGCSDIPAVTVRNMVLIGVFVGDTLAFRIDDQARFFIDADAGIEIQVNCLRCRCVINLRVDLFRHRQTVADIAGWNGGDKAFGGLRIALHHFFVLRITAGRDDDVFRVDRQLASVSFRSA